MISLGSTISSVGIGSGLSSLFVGASTAALTGNPIKSIIAGAQAGAGFALAPNRVEAFLGGLIGAGVEVAVTLVEVTFFGKQDPFRSGAAFSSFVGDALIAFSEGVFDSAIQQLNFSKILENNTTLSIQLLAPILRGIADLGADAINGNPQTNKDGLKTLLASVIEQSFVYIFSDGFGIPASAKRRITERLDRSKAIDDFILWPPGTYGDKLRADFSRNTASRIVDLAIPTLTRVIKGFASSLE